MKKLILFIVCTFVFGLGMFMAMSAMAKGGGGGGHGGGHSSSHSSSSHASSAHESTTHSSSVTFVHGSNVHSTSSDRLANCEVVDKDNMCAKYKAEESYGAEKIILVLVTLVFGLGGIALASGTIKV